MKSPTVSVILLAAALSVLALTPLSAASKNDFPVAFPVSALIATPQGGERIERGTTRADATWALRRMPHQELSPDVWVYPGYHANLDAANDHGCGTLMVTFANDKVVDLKLVNKPAAAVIAANLSRSSSVRNVASKK
jgi:hypothetical protein